MSIFNSNIPPFAHRFLALFHHWHLRQWQVTHLPRLTWPDAHIPLFVQQCGVT